MTSTSCCTIVHAHETKRRLLQLTGPTIDEFQSRTPMYVPVGYMAHQLKAGRPVVERC